MKAEEKKNDPWLNESEDKGRGIFRSIYDFISSLVMGLVGLIVFGVCLFTVFRHGSGIAEVSIIEIGLFIWLFYCVNVSKDLAVNQKRSVFVFRWRLFALTGWVTLWASLAYAAWFKWGADYGFQESFLASNLFEVSLMLVVGIGSGLGVLTSVEFEKGAPVDSDVEGEAV